MPTPAKRENIFVNLIFNIALPSLVLSKCSKPELLGPQVGLVVALLFPLGYGVWDYVQRRKVNFVSGLGFVSTLLTGVFVLTQVDGIWLAVKEACVPALIGLAVMLSMKSKRPLIREFLYNDQVIDIPKVDTALTERGCQADFERLLTKAGWQVTASFMVSAVLNFVLARWMLTAPAGSEELNAQLAKMQWMSWPVIVLPSMGMMMFALWKLLGGIKSLTGLELEEIFAAQPDKNKAAP